MSVETAWIIRTSFMARFSIHNNDAIFGLLEFRLGMHSKG
jgi:hypothetical protein